jgi:replicative DNA helicase
LVQFYLQPPLLTMAEKMKRTRREEKPNYGDRVPPHNLDAERGLIASIIIDGGETLQRCLAEKITPDYFFDPKHQDIYRTAVALSQESTGIDEITITERLRREERLESAGGVAYVNELTGLVASTAHAPHWIAIVREKHFLRCLISTSVNTVERAHAHTEGIERLLEEVEQSFFKISENRVGDSAVKIDKPVEEAMELVQKMIQEGDSIQGIPSGLIELDRLTFGFQPGQMIIVAARPGMGKTSIGLNFIEAAVFPKHRESAHILLFSLEMPARELALRLLGARARVNIQKIRSARPTPQEQMDLAQAAQEYKGKSLIIDDNGGQNILEIRAKCRRVHSQRPLDLIVIDYIQLINGLDSSLPREQQIAEVSRSIKAMAKEFKVPIVALAQLNRKSEDEGRQPRMSDLRESGSIEQDADIVLLISRPSASQSKAAEAEAELAGQDGFYSRQLIVAKNRNGPTRELDVLWNPGLTRFETPAKDNRHEPT